MGSADSYRVYRVNLHAVSGVTVEMISQLLKVNTESLLSRV